MRFEPAVREQIRLLIGLFGGTGSGKTFTAMRLAKGLAGGQRFAVIDTEAGRAKIYADEFEFDHLDLAPPFSPSRYTEAILEGDKQGYPVIVVDSMSHEYNGEGGVTEMHDAEWQRMGGSDKKKMLAWVKPKTEHKKMVSRLLQVRAHVILCFRAELKVDMQKGKDGRTKVREATWVPVTEKNLPFELTASFLLNHETPGCPNNPLKLPQKLRAFFDGGTPISEECGANLAEWAAGGAPEKKDSPALAGLLEALEKAGTKSALEAIAAEIKAAVEAGEITQRERRELGALYKDFMSRLE